MRTAALGATCFVAMSLLGGCAGSKGVGQAKPNAPVVVVGDVETPKKKAADKPKATPAAQAELAKENERMVGILGVLRGSGSEGGAFEDVWGGVPGGVIGGPGDSSGFGGLGLSGTGSGGGGIGLKGIGVGGGGRGEGFGFGVIGGIGGGPKHAYDTGAAREQVKAKFEAVTVTGPLTTDVVQRHVDDHRDDVQMCHRLEQAISGNRWGSVTIGFTIDPQGHVSEAHVHETTLSSRDLESCIAHVAGTFEFPAPSPAGEVKVLLPIRF